jgi:CheY-like chemotaxis protein
LILRKSHDLFPVKSKWYRSRNVFNHDVLHVLLIEDNPSDVLLIREAMGRSPIPADVTIASDGEQGLRLLTGARFDLVILDLNVPRFHGHGILAHYHQNQDIQEGPPVFVLSGSNNPRDREAALALGAQDYVVKPRRFEDFMQAVRGILECCKPLNRRTPRPGEGNFCKPIKMRTPRRI